MLNMDFYDTSGATSTPSTAQGTQPMRRPPLIGRSFTTGRSKRNLLSGSGGNLQSSFTTSPAQLGRSSSIDASDEVIQSFLNPNGNADESRASNQGEKEGSERDAENDGGDAIRDNTLNPPSQLQQKQLSSSPKSDNSAGPPAAAIPRPTLGRGSSYTNRGYNLRHRRVATSLPKVADLGSIGGFADSIPESAKSSMSGMTGYTSLGLSARSTPGERARFVAMTMKAANPDSAVTSSNMEEANSLMQEGALNDLVSMMEANRDAEESSRESMGGNIGESRGGGSRGSAGSRSRKSGKLSANASLSGGSHGGSFSQSNGGSSGFSGSGRRGNRHKPFAGISSPWSRDQGPLSNIDQLFQVCVCLVWGLIFSFPSTPL